MPSTVRFGFKGELDSNTGTYNSATWSAMSQVRDIAIGADFDESDGSTRIADGIKQQEPTMLGLEVTGKIRTDETDTNGYIVLETAFLNRAVIDLMVLSASQNTNGARGYRFDSKVFKFGEDQALGEILWREFSLKPCVSANQPSKAVVINNTPVFTAL